MNIGIDVSSLGISALCILGLMAVSLIWLWRDANRHGQPGLIWAVATLFVYPLGTVLWLVVRAVWKTPERRA